MRVEDFLSALGADFYTGVPDSQLKALCDYLVDHYGTDPGHHVIAANEGNCVALAAGYHLATGKVPVVYMQNSGEGNVINPLASLLNGKVYGIPVIFIIGWRGEPGVHDEPQHVYQGVVTTRLLEVMGVPCHILSADTGADELLGTMRGFYDALSEGRSVAFVVRKGALTYEKKVTYRNEHTLVREDVVRAVTEVSGDDPIISTTGKASRELYEIRDAAGQGHAYDFLTVGSMGHCSSIALGVALQRPDRRIWCIDGDGAALMHLGALPVIASCHPDNLIHIVINNGAHETVGGQPTALRDLSVATLARDCGYAHSARVETMEALRGELADARERGKLTLIEACCAIGSRADLGRPRTSAMENKQAFMEYLKKGV